MDAMASMTITYLVGAACSAVMYFIMNKNGNLLDGLEAGLYFINK